jgi:hypothetical protein
MWVFVGIFNHIWKLIFVFAIISVSSLSRLFQVTLALTILIPLLVLLVAIRPYQSGYLLFLTISSKMIVYVAFSAAGYYTEQSPTELGSGYFFGSAFLTVNFLFFTFCLRSFPANLEVYSASPITGVVEVQRNAQSDLLVPPNSYEHQSPSPIMNKEEVTFGRKHAGIHTF